MPQGDGFIFNAEDKCTVTLEYDDGAKVERIRSRGGINRYVVNGQVFEGFGTGVPLEVQQATGIRKLEVGDQSFLLNLSEQLDGPFLGKSVSGPARAKVLGKLAGTEEIDYANKELGTDIFRAKRDREGLEKVLCSIMESISEFAWIPDAEAKLTELESQIKVINDLQAQVTLLKGLHEQVTKIAENIKTLEINVDRLRPVDEVSELLRIVERDSAERNELIPLYQSLEKANHLIHESNISVLRLESLDEVQSVVAKVQQDWTQGNILCTLKTEYLQAVALKTTSESSLKALAHQYQSVLPYLKAVEEDYVNLNELCQLASCYENNRLKATSLKGIVKSLERLDEAQDMILSADQAEKELNVLCAWRSQFNSLKNSISTYSDQVAAVWREVESLESEYIRQLTELGKCPTCGGDIHIEKLREVI